jgi:hypothetical protein
VQALHFVLSLQDWQIFDGSTIDGNCLIIKSIVAGMGLLIAQARRRTDTAANSENCGE